MKKNIVGIAATVVLLALTAAPVLADSHGGSHGGDHGSDHGNKGDLANKIPHLHDAIASTLQNFVPKVETDATTLLSALSGQTAVSVTGSVYLPTDVTSSISTIQADVTQLQSTTDPATLLEELKALQKQVERTKEILGHGMKQGDSKDHASGNKLSKLQEVDSEFEKWVTDLRSADQTMMASPTDKSTYESAFKAWKHVLKDGRKIEEWSREWGNSKQDN